MRSEVARRGLARFPDPASLSATFLSPGRQGPVDITIKTLRQGGRFLVLAFEVSQLQSSKTVKLIFGTVTMADVRNERGGTDLSGIPPPNLPPQSSCAPSGWHNTRGRPPRNMWALLTTLEPPHGEKEMEEAQLARGWTKWARWTRDGDDVASPESLGFFSDLYGMPAMSKMGAWVGSERSVDLDFNVDVLVFRCPLLYTSRFG